MFSRTYLPTRFALLLSAVSLTGQSVDLGAQAHQILAAKCTQCHSAAVKMSGLDLTSREAALRGGTRGPALVAGDAAASLLLRAVNRQGKLQMPPGPPLPDAEIELLRRWIEVGARWPESMSAVQTPQWWAFRKPAAPEMPRSGSKWARNEIDEFVLAKLKANSLEPSPEADRPALIRRLSYDLTGLPPSADEVAAFTADNAPDAYEKLVERLLASPRYGEKWGRHWLDLVRYSDTAGFELDSYIADAWRYRDWVIDSFNKDKPYDRFIREQLAGDELAPEDPVAQTGTGFFCVGPNRDLFPDQADINRVETLTDFTDTTGAVFLGLTVGCARCHDHKYDPIPQRDYYKLQAVFAPAVKTKVALNRLSSLGWERQENTNEIILRELGEQIGAIQQRCRTELFDGKLAKLPGEVQEALRRDDSERTGRQRELATEFGGLVRVTNEEIRACLSQGEAERLDAIEKRLVSMFAGYRSKPFACGVTDAGDFSPKTYMPVKGSAKGEVVPPGFLSALGGGEIPEQSFERPTTGPIPMMPTTGRRITLANWIASAENPLTARVMVNRVWQYHFGRGIVATPSDFGVRGRPPSHPELLDWLAVQFVKDGWSIKSLHRRIVLSAAYRQQSNPSEAARAADPDNIWLSHFRRRRLDAEELRDSVLAAAGTLNLKAGGRPVVVPLTDEELFNMIGRKDEMWILTADPAEHTRRSIYLLQKRTFRLPMLEVFDAPESMLTCSRRDVSTTAPQALTMLNGSFALAQSRAAAAKLVGAHPDDAALVRAAWRQILARDPGEAEAAKARRFLAAQTANAGSREAAAVELVRGLLNTNEFLYVD
jgi:mono/diheme cytochrome c family protein